MLGLEVLGAVAHVEEDLEPAFSRQPVRPSRRVHLLQVDARQAGHGPVPEPGPVAGNVRLAPQSGPSLAAGNEMQAGLSLGMNLVEDALDPFGRRRDRLRPAPEKPTQEAEDARHYGFPY